MNLSDTHEDPDSVLLLYSGLEDAFIGSVESFRKCAPVACYSKKITLQLLESGGLGSTEARNRYEFEFLRNDFGDATPVFLDDETYADVSR